MTGLEIGLLSILALLLLIWAGMHVSVALGLVSLLAIWEVRGRWSVAAAAIAQAALDSIDSYVFGVVPLFVLMGYLVGVSDLGRDAFRLADRVVGRLRGGMGVATVGANAAFAAVTGISIASAAVFTKVAVPEMMRLGYLPRFAVGVVAGSSVLGMLIPPSLLLILYAVVAEQSVGDMFLAGIGPGLLMALVFGIYIVLLARFRPDRVQPLAAAQAAAAARRDRPGNVFAEGAPLVGLIALVLGGIYGGLFTPTEAGAVGAAGALLVAVARKRMDARGFWKVLVETGHVTASISLLIIAASLYSRMLALTGVPEAMGALFADAGLGPVGFLVVYVAIAVLLGTILDSSSILLILVPLALPVVDGFGMNLVWFGVVTVIAVEVGLLTPPLGLSVFVIRSTLDDPRITLGDVFAGALPFAMLMLLVILLISLMPAIAIAPVGW
ncbi:TRAP transporter large permease [Tistrella mobilis]|uniref:TRAP transporter large permease protein n=1 Tax=Tistrella mobilis (strain KA081020-065) TaxID=1110502 RepID=I3TMH6_TISMK|nr:TRAP transporter large permease subunit [Tistrella mobilis]AFK53964.1 TRAP transporter, DctM-like membrane protein [Tistrella mobilis KA081020-065]